MKHWRRDRNTIKKCTFNYKYPVQNLNNSKLYSEKFTLVCEPLIFKQWRLTCTISFGEQKWKWQLGWAVVSSLAGITFSLGEALVIALAWLHFTWVTSGFQCEFLTTDRQTQKPEAEEADSGHLFHKLGPLQASKSLLWNRFVWFAEPRPAAQTRLEPLSTGSPAYYLPARISPHTEGTPASVTYRYGPCISAHTEGNASQRYIPLWAPTASLPFCL